MGTRRDRVKKYAAPICSEESIDRICEAVDKPTKEEVDEVIREILEEYGYKSTMSVYGKNRGEGAIFQ